MTSTAVTHKHDSAKLTEEFYIPTLMVVSVTPSVQLNEIAPGVQGCRMRLEPSDGSIKFETNDGVGGGWVDAGSLGGGGGGDFSGPGSSTDNALIRFDGTGGKTGQNGQTTEDDSGNVTVNGNITVTGTVDGRDVAADGTKLDGIEASADVTDTANVTAAGALMDSEVDADLKTLSLPASTTISTFGASLVDDASASAARTTLGLVIGTDVQAHSAVLDATTASFTTADETKLDGIETGADVTDTANVTAAGALMDSEVDANLKTLTLPASTTISTWGASLVDDATASAARTTLGLAIGVDVQNHSSVLDATTASYTTALNSKLSGIETGADVTDATNVNAAGAVMNSDSSTASMSFVIDEDTMSSNSATKVPTQQSTKAYTDTTVHEQGDSADERGLINAVAHASGTADHQNRKAQLHGQSTTATFVSLTADGGSDSSTDTFQIPEDSAALLVFGVLGVKSGGSEVGFYIVEALVKRFSSTTTLVWSNVTVNYEDDSAWDVQVATYSLGIKIEAKGNTSETVNWSAYLRSVEVVD